MKKCLDYAMKHISKFPKTENQLRTQLLKKWYGENEINSSIKRLKLQNFVNDQKYAEMYIYSNVVKKWKPFFQIKLKLIQKWIDKEIINDLFYQMEEEIKDWILNWIQNEIQRYKKKWIDWFDIIRKLNSRGYSIDDIKKAMW